MFSGFYFRLRIPDSGMVINNATRNLHFISVIANRPIYEKIMPGLSIIDQMR